MYPGAHAERHPDQPAIIMAERGEVTTFAAFEAMANRIAHWFRRSDLRRGPTRSASPPPPVSAADGNPRNMAELAMAGVPDDIVRKVFWDNAARLYNVKTPV